MGDAQQEREQVTLTRVECQTLLRRMICEEYFEIMVGGFALTRTELELGTVSETITIGLHRRGSGRQGLAEGSIAEKLPLNS
jgi:hypothetical protein